MGYLGIQPVDSPLTYQKVYLNSGESFDGGTTTFNIVSEIVGDTPANLGTAENLEVILNDIRIEPQVDYTVSGSQITFTVAPTGGWSFFAIRQGQIQTLNAPADGSVDTTKILDGAVTIPKMDFSGGNVEITDTNGIDFSAQSAGSDDVNVLDFYQEGTFTPSFTCGTPGDLSVSTQNGHYTRIGNIVNISIRLTFTHTTASGTMTLDSLPFNALIGVNSPLAYNLTNIGQTNYKFNIYASGSTVILAKSLTTTGGGAQTNAHIDQITDAGDTCSLYINGAYRIG